MAKAFSLLRGFSASKFYNAPLSGSITGTGSFTFGALFTFGTIQVINQQTIFGNAVYGTSGFGIRQLNSTGLLSVSQGTVSQASGTVVADATNDATAQVLANQFKSIENGNVTVATGPARNFMTPMPNQMVLAIVAVDGSNQNLYINGQLVAVSTKDTTSNANPLRIGVDASAANPCNELFVAGAFYHSTALNAVSVAAMQAACVNAKDIASPAGLGAETLDYIWSVKTGNANIGATWDSQGGAVTPVTMTRNGTWTLGTNASDIYSADYPWL